MLLARSCASHRASSPFHGEGCATARESLPARDVLRVALAARLLVLAERDEVEVAAVLSGRLVVDRRPPGILQLARLRVRARPVRCGRRLRDEVLEPLRVRAVVEVVLLDAH